MHIRRIYKVEAVKFKIDMKLRGMTLWGVYEVKMWNLFKLYNDYYNMGSRTVGVWLEVSISTILGR